MAQTELPSFAVPRRLPSAARWADDKRTTILAHFDGTDHLVPDDPANTERMAIADWEKAGNEIADYVKPEITNG